MKTKKTLTVVSLTIISLIFCVAIGCSSDSDSESESNSDSELVFDGIYTGIVGYCNQQAEQSNYATVYVINSTSENSSIHGFIRFKKQDLPNYDLERGDTISFKIVTCNDLRNPGTIDIWHPYFCDADFFCSVAPLP